ncbi:hypothetical protein FOB64_004198 [Candida albicans]|uniref:Uncharacterized protein n=1 Tax=Candida albicans TaxID=5476 RepID=A0A8H6BYG9_CANAX|nr:hypothetical protein FOB64_004198 [Candida albicans]
MNNNLTKINQELTQIQQFDANTMKISPIKESSRIPITTANMPNNQFKPIKLHRSNTTCGGGGATGKSPSPTRIPTLQRSKSNVPEDTSPQDSTTTNNNKKEKYYKQWTIYYDIIRPIFVLLHLFSTCLINCEVYFLFIFKFNF